ncbi:unnamed protein product [Effrenium voratum]|nr:unnamed protein product [Effrenium voratum]
MEQKSFEEVKSCWGEDDEELNFLEEAQARREGDRSKELLKELQRCQFVVMRRMVIVSQVAVLTLASSGNVGLRVAQELCHVTGKGGKASKGDKGETAKGGAKGKGKKGDSEPSQEDLAAALGVDQFEEPDTECPWCQVEYTDDSNFCGSCGKPRKALNCYNCESHYLKGTRFCHSCGLPRQGMPNGNLQAQNGAFTAGGHKPLGPAPFLGPDSSPSARTIGPDPIYQDQLLKEISELEMQEYTQDGEEGLPMRDMCRSVEMALDEPYNALVHRLRGRLVDFRGRCDFAASEKQRWRGERIQLRESSAKSCRPKSRSEKDKALQKITHQANHSLSVSRGARAGRQSVRLAGGVGGHGLELMEASEQDAGAIDMATNMILRSRLGGFVVSVVYAMIPLQSDVQTISSQFGSGCGTFFKFYSYLLLLALFAALAFGPLLVMQTVEQWDSFNLRMCGTLPCSLFIGSFYRSAGTQPEQWQSAVDLRKSSNGSLAVVQDIGQEAFDTQFAACPMVRRYVRDCRTFAVFAGIWDNSSGLSPYEVFTSSWRSLPGTQNQDWVIYSRFADMVQAEEPWPRCSVNSSAANQGFPGSCVPSGFQLSGRWFGTTSFDGTVPLHGFQLETFNASRCLAQSHAEDIRNMAGGISVSFANSGKELMLAFWYVFGNLVSIIFAVLFVLGWWQMTEAKYNFEQFSEKLEPLRWSSLTLGIWNFGLTTDSDRTLWAQNVASQLRLLYAEEKEQEKVKSRTAIDQNVLIFKRCLGFAVNLAIIVGLWISIWICTRDRDYLVELLGGFFQDCCSAAGVGQWLGYNLAPLMVTGAGVVLPPVVEILTQLESWPHYLHPRLNIYRFFLGQILTAGLYLAISLELLYDLPLWTGQDLVLQPLVEPCGYYPCKADHAGAEVLALAVTESMG